jgi:peptide/nickel transport system substrate-binding protein
MRKLFPILALFQFTVVIALSSSSLAKEWIFSEKPRGVLKVADIGNPPISALINYAEGLISLDKDNNWVPCLAVDARWTDDRTIEFKLREAVRFHNGEKFNAQVVRINWEAYKKMKSPRPQRFLVPSDETELKIVDEYTVQFTFPEPDGLAFVKFRWFFQFAPSFFEEHKFEEGNWGYLSEPGPWGTGAFKLVEGSLRFGRPSDQLILEANDNYWDPHYPRVQRVIFENRLIGDRDEAMRLCRETEGNVDIVNFVRPLDTLKIAESPYAKVLKSRDVTAFVGSFNMRKTGSKWLDIRLRKAINYAINREELWKYAAKGNAHSLGVFIPLGAYGHNPDLNLYTYDTETARSLLSEAGYPEGFEVKIIAHESVKLEAQIMKRMLERVGLRVNLHVVTLAEWFRKYFIPLLDKPPEEQEWDLFVYTWQNYHGNPAATFLNFGYIEESDFRWIEYDPIYEEMWKGMAKTVDVDAQEERIRELVKYVYDRAYSLFVYSPISLYAVNKEVEFVPYEDSWLHFKETSVTDNHWSIREQD